jgi:nucleoside-diphosphate-sugar epimerase
MRYFLTGATGFLGGALARHLRAAGHEVHALVRNPRVAGHLTAVGVVVHEGDVTNRDSLRPPMEGADGIFHVAGWYKVGVRDRASAVNINVEGTRNVLGVMRELQIAKGVYTSSLAVNSDTHGQVVDETYRFNGRHVSLYDWSKAEAHKIALQHINGGLPLVIVQPGLIYGPGDTSGVRTTLLQYLRRKLPVVPAKATYCWAHVDDEVRGHALAMEGGEPGRSYFLAGPVHTLVEALDLAASFTGIPAPRVRLPSGVLKSAAMALRLIDPFIHLPPAYSPESLRVLAGVTYIGSSARARKELGWQVRPLREGLMETLRHEMQLLGMTPRFWTASLWFSHQSSVVAGQLRVEHGSRDLPIDAVTKRVESRTYELKGAGKPFVQASFEHIEGGHVSRRRPITHCLSRPHQFTPRAPRLIDQKQRDLRRSIGIALEIQVIAAALEGTRDGAVDLACHRNTGFLEPICRVARDVVTVSSEARTKHLKDPEAA